ncbi:unnamed protein product [Citrullus colocynthis]|uniref:Uncharacterized protein n=1 Tax=Citrullus colocynthis TaxID=252529 RepID=A0ABP0Y0E9_9ROSI
MTLFQPQKAGSGHHGSVPSVDIVHEDCSEAKLVNANSIGSVRMQPVEKKVLLSVGSGKAVKSVLEVLVNNPG